MLMLEAFFKFGAIGAMIALGLLVLRDGRHISALKFATPLIATMISTMLTTGSDELRLGGELFFALRLFDMLTTVFIWLLGLALFDDDFHLSLREYSILALYIGFALPVRLHYLGSDILWIEGMDIVSAIIALGMMSHLAYRAVIGRQEDLLEKRRRARVWFAVAIALVLIMAILSERTAIAMNIDARLTIWVTYAFTLPITIWATLWLTRLQPEALVFQSIKITDDTTNSRKPLIDPRDIEAHSKLVSIMEDHRGFAEHGLTIGKLANQIGMPAHQLRALINRSMGYQNFSAFLNHYRIKDVKLALAAQKNARIPILTLAMDAGFSSLAPFNRAFKSSVGVTPTEYRNQILNKTSNMTDQF